MYTTIKNDNYGYAVATYGDYVVVSNPPSLRWNSTTQSAYYTGSFDIFKYNKASDQHEYINSYYKSPETIEVDLASELANPSPTGPEYLIDTENNFDILIDNGEYNVELDDSFGTSLDLYNTLLVVGSSYFKQAVATDSTLFTATGSTVEVHDISLCNTASNTQPSYITTIYNPDLNVTESFGKSVSINSSWIAIGSPYVSSSRGMVYIYRNTSTGSAYSWELFQKLQLSSSDAKFGWDLKLNKQSGSLSQSIIIGCGNSTHGHAYYYEYTGSIWQQTYVFNPTNDVHPLTFGNYTPYQTTMSVSSSFGKSVSLFDTTAVIGAYTDRTIYEFSGSALYYQGACYVYEKCTSNISTNFSLSLKTYGSENILKNNRLGYSVDVFGNNIIAGSPKIDNDSMTPCYIGGTINQAHYCDGNVDETLHGQSLMLQKNTSSLNWEILNLFQRKKKFLSPYRAYGNDVSIANKSMVVGAPLNISGSTRNINIYTTSSNGIPLDDIMGKSYIHNLDDLENTFHVGNVFYNNGKVILMTSGSSFSGLLYNPINTNTYEYDLQFKSKHTIFEKQVICPISPGEFNVSTNPTAIFRSASIFDINGNGKFDFQDVDIILRYMQYKNTSNLGTPTSTDWSSSIVRADDEISLYNYYVGQLEYNANQTSTFTSQSINVWETIGNTFQESLDFNGDNKVDVRDMNILWKYFSNRLSQENYSAYITSKCRRTMFSEVIDYLSSTTQKDTAPTILSSFQTYNYSASLDRTGSYLAPLATTVGLYSGLDLVCIAKLGTPIKIIPELPINIIVKMDY